MTVHMVAVGSLFDGRAEVEIEGGIQVVLDTVAQIGEDRIQNTLGDVLQNPTGYYESKIHTNRAVYDRTISDLPVVYGPWLEGVGSRNQTTRFKGYATFRKVAQSLEKDADMIAVQVLTHVMEALNA